VLAATVTYLLSVQQNPRSTPAPTYTVEAVDRALLLLALLRDRGRVSVTQAAAELGTAPSTAHRLLATLVHRGWAVQGPGRQYEPGPELHGHSTQRRSLSMLARRVRPVLADVFAEIGETVHLTVLAGADVRFIDGIEGDQTLRVALRIGTRMPAHTTSGGKAMLAELPADELEARYADGLQPWSTSGSRTLDDLTAELARTADRGYGWNDNESESGVSAVGISLGTPDGEHHAAVSVAMPTARVEVGDRERLAAALLRARARARLALARHDV
jgi:IclR family transcriptional regulator, acetate operon repressor